MIYEKDLSSFDINRSSGGVLLKWTTLDKKYFIKSSSFNKISKSYNYEAIVECLVSDLLDLLKVPHLRYTLDLLTLKSGDILYVCVSDNYKIETSTYISPHTLLTMRSVEIKNRSEIYYYLINTFPEVKKDLNTQIVVDFLINNSDRHLRNFELCYDGMNVNLVPLFDNGSSLFSDWTDGDLVEPLEDKELFEENVISFETPSKAFSFQHNTDLRLVKEFTFNYIPSEEDIIGVIDRYKPYMSSERCTIIKCILLNRMKEINRRYYNTF